MPAGGTVSTPDSKVYLNFPAGAVTSDTFVSIASTTPPGPPPEGFKLSAITFSITTTPSAYDYLTPIQICVKYSVADLAAAEGDPAALNLAFYDVAAGSWVDLDTKVITPSGLVCAWTSHASVWSILSGSEYGGGLFLGAWIGIGIGGLLVILLVYWWVRRFRY